jgi:hypothetical protein
VYEDNTGFKEFLNSQTQHSEPWEDTAATPFDNSFDVISDRKSHQLNYSLGMPDEEQSLVLGLS